MLQRNKIRRSTPCVKEGLIEGDESVGYAVFQAILPEYAGNDSRLLKNQIRTSLRWRQDLIEHCDIMHHMQLDLDWADYSFDLKISDLLGLFQFC